MIGLVSAMCSLLSMKSMFLSSLMFDVLQILTKFMPRYQATGTMSHIKSPCWVRKPLRSHDANHSRNSPLQCKLDLCLVCVPWCKRHCQDVPPQQVSTPTCYLNTHNQEKVYRGKHISKLNVIYTWTSQIK